MKDASAASSYGRVARAAHWLIAALIVCGFTLGLVMADLAVSPTRLRLFAVHKSVGVTVFALMLLRLGWRLAVPPPPLPDSLPDWERRLSLIWHRMLYVLGLAIPVTGWLMSSARGYQTVYLDLLPIPDLLGKDRALGEILEETHFALNMVMAGFVAVHVAAALKHRFIDHDGILERMWPARRP